MSHSKSFSFNNVKRNEFSAPQQSKPICTGSHSGFADKSGFGGQAQGSCTINKGPISGTISGNISGSMRGIDMNKVMFGDTTSFVHNIKTSFNAVYKGMMNLDK